MSNAGYGFGLSTFVAGVVLVRFSALGSFSGKLTPRLRERIVALVGQDQQDVWGIFGRLDLLREILGRLLDGPAYVPFERLARAGAIHLAPASIPQTMS